MSQLLARLPAVGSRLTLEIWFESDGSLRFEVKPGTEGSVLHDGFYEEFDLEKDSARFVAKYILLCNQSQKENAK